MEANADNLLYFPVANICIEDLGDFAAAKSRNFCRGRLVQVNGKKIALVKYQGKVFAMDENCPHMGGPLHLGDIESLGVTGLPCIVCPWHKWKFSLETGSLKHPSHDDDVRVNLYPVRVEQNGTISVGFTSFDKNCFHRSDF